MRTSAVRPRAIRTFELLYLTAFAIAVVNAVTSWSRNAALIREAGPGVTVAGHQYWATGVGLLIPLLLWYFIAHRGSIIAKWVAVVMFVFGLVSVLSLALLGQVASGVGAVLAMVAFACQAGAIAMLFRSDARVWLGESLAEEGDE